MSKLDELIKELCPNGVEYRKLKDVATFRAGWTFPKGEQGLATGEYPFYKVADMNASLMYMQEAQNYISEKTVKKLKCKPAPKGTIIFPKVGATMATNKKRILTVDSCYDNNVMGIIATGINATYLYYLISRITLLDFANGTGAVPSLDKTRLEEYQIPVPPLPIQQEIVRILDSFTELTAELQQQLDAELTARKKQYEYYRDSLLTFGDDVPMVKLGDVAHYSKDRIDCTILNEDNYVSVENMLQNRAGKRKAATVLSEGNAVGYNCGDVLIGNIRPYLKKIWLADCNGGTNGDVLVIRSKDKTLLHPKYLYCVLASDGFFNYDNNNAKGAKMPRGHKAAVMQYEFSLPPLDEQERIVAILDRFDALCNDLSSGLPAEIDARQKQYEYYRDKLLSFPPAE